MASEPEKAELDRERRELRQMRAELERRVADFDKRQVCTHVTLLCCFVDKENMKPLCGNLQSALLMKRT